MELGEEKHPADEIALALSRAGGILSSLSHCYNAGNKDFAIGSAFMAEAIKSTEDILLKANESLTRLYQDYSLASFQDEQADELVRSAAASFETTAENNSELDFVGVRRNSGGSNYKSVSELASMVSNDIEDDLDDQSEDDSNATVEQMIGQPAQSYQELLEKLTSMVDAASYRSAEDDTQLLPVLESLRSDLLRLKTA